MEERRAIVPEEWCCIVEKGMLTRRSEISRLNTRSGVSRQNTRSEANRTQGVE